MHETIGALLHHKSELYAGTEGGVFASRDLGDSWRSVSPESGIRNVTALASEGDKLYAAGEAGLVRLDAEWTTLLTTQVNAVAALDGGVLLAGTELDGVLRSEDGGATWRSATAGLLDSAILALAVSPPSARERIVLAGTESGVYLSRNDGKAWRFAALPGEDLAVQCLAIAHERLAFAGTEAGGLLRSHDGGLSWQTTPVFAGRGVTAVAAAGSFVAAASGSEIVLSRDGSERWQTIAHAAKTVWSLHLRADAGRCALIAGQAAGGVLRLEI